MLRALQSLAVCTTGTDELGLVPTERREPAYRYGVWSMLMVEQGSSERYC